LKIQGEVRRKIFKFSLGLREIQEDGGGGEERRRFCMYCELEHLLCPISKLSGTPNEL
jgi:hypothetical protein